MRDFGLLPNKYKMIGWCVLIPSIIVGIFIIIFDFESTAIQFPVFAVYNDEIMGDTQIFQIIKTNITPTLTGILLIIGALLVAFSKEENEDEFIASLRLSSLQWAVLVNYVFLCLSFLLIYGTGFFNVMVYNMFTVLIIFIVRFHYVLFISNKQNS